MTPDRTQAGHQVDEYDVIPFVHPWDEATEKSQYNASAAALMAPETQSLVFYVLESAHLSKTGVTCM